VTSSDRTDGRDARDDPDAHATVTGTDSRGPVPVPLAGVAVDDETRCAHYHGDRDVVAMRFACCDRYYPCAGCHEAVTDHTPERLPPDRFDEPAVLCGVCGTRLSVREYRAVLTDGEADGSEDEDAGEGGAGSGRGVADPRCPDCGAGFNPGCLAHLDRYFAIGEDRDADGDGDG
jgi:uncharacterized CHY-type Zn-finger protein